MSLLDNPPHVVTVTVMTPVTNQYNGFDLIPTEPIRFPCAVQPVTTEEVASSAGTVVMTDKRIIARGPWPGGVHSIVNWDGRDWDQQGEARTYSMSPRTAHIDVIIRARKSEVK